MWLEEQLNHPDRSDYYQMQTAALLTKDRTANQMVLEFGVKKAATPASAAMRSRSRIAAEQMSVIAALGGKVRIRRPDGTIEEPPGTESITP